MEITNLFIITYFAAFVGVLPPGLVNMSVAKTCLHKGKRNGVLVATGASIVVLLQALVAVLLAGYIFSNPFVQNVFLRAGIVIFIILGIYFFIAAQKASVKKVKIPKNAGRRSLGKGMLVSALNVLPIPYFCAISAALNLTGNLSNRWIDILAFILAASGGTFTALYLYVAGFDRVEKKAKLFTKYSNYFMAGLMMILVILTLIRMHYADE